MIDIGEPLIICAGIVVLLIGMLFILGLCKAAKHPLDDLGK